MLSDRESNRYKRQILHFGRSGQEKLKNAHIFIAGAGGIGSPVSIYLAVAGVGTLTIVDCDVVELSNLNRQVLHHDRDIGRKKTESAEEKLREINPDISIRAVDTTIDAKNAGELVGNADGIVDAMDNFSTRYILNEVAVQKEIPFFHGAIRGLSGQVTTIIPRKTACLRCIFPHPPPPEVFPVVGVAPGLIGMLQATEVIKYLTGEGDLLTNRLIFWDGSRACIDEIAVERDPRCPSCAMGNEPGSAGDDHKN